MKVYEPTTSYVWQFEPAGTVYSLHFDLFRSAWASQVHVVKFQNEQVPTDPPDGAKVPHPEAVWKASFPAMDQDMLRDDEQPVVVHLRSVAFDTIHMHITYYTHMTICRYIWRYELILQVGTLGNTPRLMHWSCFSKSGHCGCADLRRCRVLHQNVFEATLPTHFQCFNVSMKLFQHFFSKVFQCFAQCFGSYFSDYLVLLPERSVCGSRTFFRMRHWLVYIAGGSTGFHASSKISKHRVCSVSFEL